MSVRAKFTCQSKEHDTSDPAHGTVTLEAVHSGSPENEEFFNMTPSGQISLGILNPYAFDQFEPGKDYYVDFSPAN